MPDLLHDRVVAALGDRYEVEREVARGGMAVVFRARDVRLRRLVALKVLPPDLAFRAGVRDRFLREAETAARLTHPHVVPIYAADEVDGLAYIAMAFVDGETLGQRLEREPRPPLAYARRLLAEVADALAYAHAHGVVHRDVKPGNVLVDRESGRSMVTDFGIARAAEADLRLTTTGATVGTPAYMSPEQALGESEVDGRSDIYSLGVVAYQLLTGVLPFSANGAAAMLMKHVGETPRPIRERAPDVPPPLAAAVERALAKRSADRWPDALSFRDALLDAGSGPAPRPTPAIAPPVAPPPAAPIAPPIAPPTVPTRALPGDEIKTVYAMEAAPRPAGHALAPRNGEALRGLMRGEDPRSAPRELLPDVSAPLPPRGAPSRDWRTPPPREAFDSQREWRDHLRQQRRAHKERTREEREAWRDYWKVQQRSGMPVPLPAPGMPLPGGPEAAGLPPLSLEQRAELFRSKLIRSVLLMMFLVAINAMHVFVPPWFLFPVYGITSGLRRRWRPLRAEGLRLSEVLFEGPSRAATLAGGRTGRLTTGGRATPAGILVEKLRRRASQAAVLGGAALGSVIIGASFNADVMIPFCVLFTVLTVLALLSGVRTAFRVRRAGVSVREALSSRWEQAVALADPRPREAILGDEMARLASDAVAGSEAGRALRAALDDRMTIRETMTKLSPEDRAMIPDVMPTVDALVERVAGLAQSLQRLEGDAHPAQLAQLDERLAQLRAEPAGTPDRARKLQLLERQRATLADLVERRATLAAQMESAQLVLQNVKLDLLKLRSAGVGALSDVGSATQEARALSRDIQYALEAAAEVRGR